MEESEEAGERHGPDVVAGEAMVRRIRGVITTHIKVHPQFLLVRQMAFKHRQALIEAIVSDVCAAFSDYLTDQGFTPPPSRDAEDA